VRVVNILTVPLFLRATAYDQELALSRSQPRLELLGDYPKPLRSGPDHILSNGTAPGQSITYYRLACELYPTRHTEVLECLRA
jgi:hypothetical protein